LKCARISQTSKFEKYMNIGTPINLLDVD